MFRERDVTRAVKAVTKAGVQVDRVEIGPDGKIIVAAARPDGGKSDDEVERWIAKHAHKRKRT